MKFISSVVKFALSMVGKIFGTISWSPPPWTTFLRNFSSNIANLSSRLGDRLRAFFNAVKNYVNTSVKNIMKRTGIVLGVFFAVIALIIGYAVWQSGTLRFTGTPPGLTELEDVLNPDPIHINFSGSAARRL